ncbi:MAG TPA: ribonuclease HII [Verrucomicrobiae bacterium]|nr:ribonuclease HII [Verrucomicrobiae bacterium]
MPSLRYEKKAYENGANLVAGIDEAGRGPLAGPVVAAAVILPRVFRHKTLNDSKQLMPEKREAIFAELTVHPAIAWAVGISEVEIIDRYNILAATWRAMKTAVDALPAAPDHLLIDGLPVPIFKTKQTAIVQGDCKSYSIAAASVIAKVTRDRLMLKLHEQFPSYNFAHHKGYATPEHFAALGKFGPSPVHRKSFAPVYHAFQMVQKEFETVRSAS